ncbi:LysM peptidoglycan-binding domain-containing protein [Patescibacteria group bacterium]
MKKKNLKGFLKTLKSQEKAFSRVLGFVVVLVIGYLIFNYFQPTSDNQFSIFENSNGKITTETSPSSEEEKREKDALGISQKYQVKTGDSLWDIAEKTYRSGYNWVDLASANNLNSPYYLEAGQELTLPQVEPKEITLALSGSIETKNKIDQNSYEIQENDSLWKIAIRAYGDGYRWGEIAAANHLENPSIIHTGNTLVIPR